MVFVRWLSQTSRHWLKVSMLRILSSGTPTFDVATLSYSTWCRERYVDRGLLSSNPVCVCVCVCMCVWECVCVFVCLCLCVCVCVCVLVFVCVPTHVQYMYMCILVSSCIWQYNCLPIFVTARYACMYSVCACTCTVVCVHLHVHVHVHLLCVYSFYVWCIKIKALLTSSSEH